MDNANASQSADRMLSSPESQGGDNVLVPSGSASLGSGSESEDHVPSQPAQIAADPEIAIRRLYEKQDSLQQQLTYIRQQQGESSQQDQPSEDVDAEKGGSQKGGQKASEAGEDNGGGDSKNGQHGNKEKDEQKPTFKQRLAETTQKTGEWMRKHRIATVLLAFGFIVSVIGTILLIRYLDSYVDTDDAFLDGHTDPISFRVSGIVKAVYVENTSLVRKGQLLVELDGRDNQVAKEQASASYAQAEASARAQAPNVPIAAVDQRTQVSREDLDVVSARANVAATEERYRSALADLHQAQASQGNAAREEERYRQLVVKQEVTREQYDQRETEAKAQTEIVASRAETANAASRSITQARAMLAQTEAQAAQARENRPRQIQVQRELLTERKAAELTAKARADQAELNLEYTRIFAPEDGIVGDKQVQIATQVAAGQELFALTQVNDIWITANFKETQLERMRAGQSVTVHVDALKLDFQGYVEALPGASGAVYSLLPPENAVGNYVKVVQRLPVRIRLHPGQDGLQRLRPGMSVEPKVWLR